MRFHVVSLPHTQTTQDYVACAFTEKVRKFCIMMTSLGHSVYLYAGEQNEAPCNELITCISEEMRAEAVGNKHYTAASFDISLPHWQHFNKNVIEGIKKRATKTDFICVIGGIAHKPIADAIPELMTVEFGIGYGGFFAKYKVFESYAWMHTCYGTMSRNANNLDGNYYDVVIPGYLEPEKFPFRETPDDYFMFIGRLVPRKGFNVAAEVCEKIGARLILAGEGNPPKYGEHVGVIGPEERGRLLAGAIATFAPTQYIEPFGNVVPEAHACGTPTITTDWGAFTETVINGVNGYRCRTFKEYIEATEKVRSLDRQKVRETSLSRYSLDVVALQYEAYFKRLLTLWDDGWYTL